MKNKSVIEVLREIEKNSEYIFLYHDENLETNRKVSVNAQEQTIDKVLDEVFKGTDNTYYISDRQVFISKSESDRQSRSESGKISSAAQEQISVSGTVSDRTGPIPGVSVFVKGTTIGVNTSVDGKYKLNISEEGVLVFSFVGMKTKEIKLVPGTTVYDVVMESDEIELSSAVVQAGIIKRDKAGFTGSYNTINQEELRSVGSINVIQSLKSLDPSFIVAENNLKGSDPNTMANINIRGGSTMNISSTFDDLTTNPNEPLFILDGFETTLQVVNDLDINRIESITILKDAGSTAIYGSKGGNGVIVIETIKPKVGKLRVSYNGNMALELPDLSVYNLMNAREKLEYELKAGRYGNINDWWGNADKIAEYYSRMERVERGVDTYWLKVPVRTGLTQSHSVNVDGGESSFLYQAGVNFQNVQGVMKGSSRQSFGGNMRLQYRKEKINVQNHLSLSVTNEHRGSWGSFEDFAKANPYYEMRNADGTIPDELDTFRERAGFGLNTATNPYYNAMLPSRNDSRYYNLTNNTAFDWSILKNLRWSGSLQLASSTGENVSFKDPRHTDYKDRDYTQQGEYTSNNNSSWRYKLNTTVNYSLSLLDAHNLTFIGHASIESTQSNGEAYSVTGFPKGVEGIPSYSYSYKEGSRPAYSETIRRAASFILAMNYNYKFRYLFDFNYNADGSTAFGRNQKFQNFWSIGLGWNIKREAFAENWTWLQNLKLRGSYGVNGNQNVNNLSMNVYSYFPGNDIFGAASYLSGYANPNLRWRVVTKTSAGIDASTLDNRLNIAFDLYQTHTDPMDVNLEQKLSSGVSTYPVNMGYIKVKGLEVMANYQVIRNVPKEINLNIRFTARTNKFTYGGFAQALANLNEEYKKDQDIYEQMKNINSLVQYQDGGSPDDLRAVRSLGIDPATGREIFLSKDGVPTFDYKAEDRVVIASRNPAVEGIFGFTFRFKNLTANFNFRYSIGGYEFNQALFNKVENITASQIIFNQDRRALYSRWEREGDISEFKNIDLTQNSTTTPVSSRFIQRNNYLSGESAKLSWNFSKDKWIKLLKLADLQLHVAYNDIFYLSTMKRERGIESPYKHSITMGITAVF
jgi:TonB-linked SusC/RagA family outer membrane protein